MTPESAPVIAIVGRANVGKSTLFNRLVGSRRAIVHDRPGVTRDRIIAWTNLRDRSVWMVDTGGLEPSPTESMAAIVNEQVMRAARDANLLLVVFDGRDGLLPADQEIWAKLRPLGKLTLAIVNKIDGPNQDGKGDEFHSLGVSEIVEVSSEHNRGMDELLDAIVRAIPPSSDEKAAGPQAEAGCRLAFVGRPNVGKSSLVNRILGDERMVVSDQPGTTRDTVDTPLTVGAKSYLLLDTAGIRRRGKVVDQVEHYSVVKALNAIDRADVVVMVVEGTARITTQDERIAAAAIDRGVGVIVAVNKWDLSKDTPAERARFRDDLYADAPFLDFAAVRFVSARTGAGVAKLLADADHVRQLRTRVFPEEKLSRAFHKIYEARPPYGSDGFRLRIKSLEQAKEKIPTFFVWCNNPKLVYVEYERYWRNALIEELGLEGIPARVIFRRKPLPGKRPREKPRTRSNPS